MIDPLIICLAATCFVGILIICDELREQKRQKLIKDKVIKYYNNLE